MSHEVQMVTLAMQSLQHEVNALELEYLSKIKLKTIEQIAIKELGMKRQSQVHVFSNQSVGIR